ncbi:MAG: D-galactonate dehydratase [Actinomycetota bacterium]|jgi:galactonate dehydratase|nr:D-galactonate dehydratase [Actinomycetota bacterium]
MTRIARVEALVCNARMRNWIFVKVLTDDDGLWGWGEATLEWHTREVVGAIEDLEDLLLGQDPTRIEYLWQLMFRQHFWHGNNLVRSTAISGIDIALWDILGKIHGVPCHRLWGGPVRDRVRLYCHLGGGKMEDFYDIDVTQAGRFAELALRAVADGFTAMKAMAVPPTKIIEGMQAVRAAEGCVAAMRDAVGEETDLMVDCHARPSPAMGCRFARALDDYGLLFLEEPCWPEYREALAEIRSTVSTPIATGERVVGLHAFRDLFQAKACDVCQLDVTHVGGLSEARRVAALARAYGVALAPHNPQGPVSTAASIELGFAEPDYLICEAVHEDVPWRGDILTETRVIEETGRTALVSDLPGLGVELNEAELAKHPFEQELVESITYSDGAVGDW